MRAKAFLASVVAFLCFSAIPVEAQVGNGFFLSQGSAASALAIDGSAVTQATGQTAAFTLTLSTTKPGDVIYVVFRNGTFPTAPGLASITDTAGLTWTARKDVNVVNGGNGLDVALWSAYSPGILTNDVITLTPSANMFGKATAFAVSGANAGTHFDANASIPAFTSSIASTTSLSTTISTNNASDMLIAVAACNVTGNCGAMTPPSGFTSIGGVATQYDVSYKVVSATQSSVAEQYTLGSAGSGVFLYGMIVDAVAH